MKTLTSEQKQALATLRARLGGVSEQKRQAQRHLIAARKSIRKLLETQPATVPAIAEALNMPADEALWHVTGMRKYGDVAEVGEEGDYPLYSLVIVGEKAAAGH
jgi:hypothetical protein